MNIDTDIDIDCNNDKNKKANDFYKNKSVKEKIIKIYKNNAINEKIKNEYKMKQKKEKIKEKYKNIRMREKIKEKYKEEYIKNLMVDAYLEKRNEDTIYKIIDNLANRVTKILKEKNVQRTMTHMELIGCDPITLKEFISNKFIDNMSFDNYPEWEVDHIKPISSYNLKENEQLLECFNYKNLQPLWKYDNRTKSDKY